MEYKICHISIPDSHRRRQVPINKPRFFCHPKVQPVSQSWNLHRHALRLPVIKAYGMSCRTLSDEMKKKNKTGSFKPETRNACLGNARWNISQVLGIFPKYPSDEKPTARYYIEGVWVIDSGVKPHTVAHREKLSTILMFFQRKKMPSSSAQERSRVDFLPSRYCLPLVVSSFR